MEKTELWWHEDCLKRIVVKWLDSENGVKWLEGREHGSGSPITLTELTESGWERVNNPKKDGVYPRTVIDSFID